MKVTEETSLLLIDPLNFFSYSSYLVYLPEYSFMVFLVASSSLRVIVWFTFVVSNCLLGVSLSFENFLKERHHPYQQLYLDVIKSLHNHLLGINLAQLAQMFAVTQKDDVLEILASLGPLVHEYRRKVEKVER